MNYVTAWGKAVSSPQTAQSPRLQPNYASRTEWQQGIRRVADLDTKQGERLGSYFALWSVSLRAKPNSQSSSGHVLVGTKPTSTFHGMSLNPKSTCFLIPGFVKQLSSASLQAFAFSILTIISLKTWKNLGGPVAQFFLLTENCNKNLSLNNWWVSNMSQEKSWNYWYLHCNLILALEVPVGGFYNLWTRARLAVQSLRWVAAGCS